MRASFDPPTLSPALKSLLEHVPSVDANPVGGAVRSAFQAWIWEYTPGEASYASGVSFKDVEFAHISFRDVLFDNADWLSRLRERHRAQGVSFPTNGLPAEKLACAMLCEVIRAGTSLGSRINEQATAKLLDPADAVFRDDCAGVYMQLYPEVFSEIVQWTEQIGGAAKAKEQYLALLKHPNFLNTEAAKALGGDAPQAAWHWYHHWIKLSLLGASEAELVAVACDPILASLLIPGDVFPAGRNWRRFSRWIISVDGRLLFNHAVLSEACRNIGRSRPYYENNAIAGGDMNSYSYSRMEQAEGYAIDFLDGVRSPGYDFTRGFFSCFAPETLVLMADGTLCPITTVQPGDQVDTPAGPRTVRMNVAVPLAGRTLYRFSGRVFAFTATHPFRLSGDGPIAAALDPAGAQAAMPGFAKSGIVGLHGVSTMQWMPHGTATPVVERVCGDHLPASTMLHDLSVDAGPDDIPVYYAGDAKGVVLVLSEVPASRLSDWTVQAGLHAAALIADRRHPPAVLTTLAALHAAPGSADAWLGNAFCWALAEATRPQRLPLASTPVTPTMLSVMERLAGVRSKTGAMAGSPVAASDAGMGGRGADVMEGLVRYDYVAGGLIARMVANHALELDLLAAAAWQVVPREVPNPEVMAVAMGAVTLDPSCIACGHSGRLSVDVSRGALMLGALSPMVTEPASIAGYQQRLATVDYLPLRTPLAEDMTEFTLRCRWELPHTALEGAVTIFPSRTHPYWFATIPLWEPNGRLSARLSIPIRLLNAELMSVERSRCSDWTHAQTEILISQFARLFAARLKQTMRAPGNSGRNAD
ncbi:hypothetical protein [Massilia sp. erpn]|uniref:hypothetical protein n=1 Tax=Massilia sp. erpn TaxID=2738142 RepID=UPI002104EEFF|nr:hypothetical protein [Massilia sp. erpn]UTY59610.1 hypothetical protein HPQ68_22000 [Massilia sp. erpn]